VDLLARMDNRHGMLSGRWTSIVSLHCRKMMDSPPPPPPGSPPTASETDDDASARVWMCRMVRRDFCGRLVDTRGMMIPELDLTLSLCLSSPDLVDPQGDALAPNTVTDWGRNRSLAQPAPFCWVETWRNQLHSAWRDRALIHQAAQAE
jgi:hypothetical protein